MSTKVRPGTRVLVSAESAVRGTNVPSGKAFIVGEAKRGLGPTRVTSIADFERHFGPRQHYSLLFDVVQTAFAEGLAEAWISRVVGENAATAETTIDDTSTEPLLAVKASSPGDWGNDLTVTIGGQAGSWTVTVDYDGDTVAEWKRLADAGEIVARLDESRWVDATLEGDEGGEPDTGEFSLSGGDDDRTNIGSDEQQDALDRFETGLGFGQVLAADWTGVSERQMLLDHAAKHGRVALLDAPEAAEHAALVTIGEDLDDRLGMLVSSWVEIPPRGRGPRRRVPGSAMVAGLIAAGDREAGTANNAPAGHRGRASYVTDVVTRFTEPSDINELTDAGVNLIRRNPAGGVQLYGYRSQSFDPSWLQFSQVRLAELLRHEFTHIADRFLFRIIDGQRSVLPDFRDALKSRLVDEWQADGLFGDGPDDAFRINVDESVNPEEELAAGNIRAVVTARFSPFAEFIEVELVRLGADGTV